MYKCRYRQNEISIYAQMQIYANGDKQTCINIDIYQWRSVNMYKCRYTQMEISIYEQMQIFTNGDKQICTNV